MSVKLLLLLSCTMGIVLESSLAFSTSSVSSRLHRPAFASRPLLMSTAKGGEEEKELTVDAVAEMIDTTFVNGCMQLAQGYVDVLKLFIASIKSGYEMGVAPLDLVEKVESVETKAAGRELMAEEVRLRNTWIQVVYMMLNDANSRPKEESVDQDIVTVYAPAIPALKERQEAGEEFRPDGLLELKADDPMENAIVSQSLRVMWLTLVVLEEEERCNNEFARQDAPLKPTIPGGEMPTSL